ncbi:MAG: DUF2339 domain-containing protein, partial [Casimicrobiaceae bacterium]
MLIAIGIIAGLILGVAAAGFEGALAGGFTGFIIALALRSRQQLKAREAQGYAMAPGAPVQTAPGAAPDAVRSPAEPAPTSAPAAVAPPPPALTVTERLALIESRLARIEGQLVASSPARSGELPRLRDEVEAMAAGMTPTPPVVASVPGGVAPPLTPAPSGARDDGVDAAAPAGFARTADGTFAPIPAPRGVAAAATTSQRTANAPPDAPPANPVWAWVTGGNLLTRVGVLILFFGVAFLLRYFAELVTIPIEVKLAGVAVAGIGLTVVGLWLSRTRPGYGISLAGAGAGTLYLTTYAALRLYAVLPPAVALALFVAIALLTVGLALRTDAQPLAGLAIAGGFLAP